MTAVRPLPGAPELARRDGDLMLESVSLEALAREHGTPLFVYSSASIVEALASYRRGFAGRDVRVHYAMKANPSLGLLKLLADAGCGFDIVSGGELERALAVGADPASIVFSGVGKTRAEMRRALGVGIGCFNVESESELAVLSDVAVSVGARAPVSLRVNPDVDPKTHPYISTGLKASKFGVAHRAAPAAYRRAASLPGLRVVGIDCHIGSQITSISPYLDAADRMLDLVEAIEADGIPIEHIDLGGGLGIDYGAPNDSPPPPADELWARLWERLDARGHGQRRYSIEPGRSLVGNAGVCVTEVLFLKPGDEKNFCVVDAAMNDLPRPALYQAHHAIVPVKRTAASDAESPSVPRWEVVGPVCESGDWIGRDRALDVREGDLLAVLSAGAYCMSMASNYNTRNRAAEVLVDGAAARVIRRRERVEDQLRLERDY